MVRPLPYCTKDTAFVLFDTGYWIAWFVGGVAMGLLNDKSLIALALFSTILQLSAIPVILLANRLR
jgi:hypothetical protein